MLGGPPTRLTKEIPSMFTRTFLLGMGERALKTAAQTLLSSLIIGSTIWSLNWPEILGITATATLASVLTSIGDYKRTDTAIATGAAPEL